MFLCFLVPSLTCAAEGRKGEEYNCVCLETGLFNPNNNSTAEASLFLSNGSQGRVDYQHKAQKNRKQKIETETETKIETESDITTTTTTTDRRGGYLGQTRRRC